MTNEPKAKTIIDVEPLSSPDVIGATPGEMIANHRVLAVQDGLSRTIPVVEAERSVVEPIVVNVLGVAAARATVENLPHNSDRIE